MRKIFSELTTDLVTIRTILAPDPTEVNSFDDIADFKLLLRRQRAKPVVVHFQLDLRFPPSLNKVEAAGMSRKLFAQLLQHIDSKDFRDVFGMCFLVLDGSEARTQTARLREVLERMARYNGIASQLRAIREVPGALSMDIRLPRGINIRCVHPSQKDEMAEIMRPANGTIQLFDEPYTFYLWRPAAVSLRGVPVDVIYTEFMREFTRSFPFIADRVGDIQFEFMPEFINQAIPEEQPQ